MKILDSIKRFIWWYSPFVWKTELLEIEEAMLEMIEAIQEYELLMRNDMRLMFNEMNKGKAKKVPAKKNGTGNMYG